jgi:hypothetical protein
MHHNYVFFKISQLTLAAPTPMEEIEEIPQSAEPKNAKRRRSTSEIDGESRRRLSKRVRALEESETENRRTQKFITSLNSLLSPFDLKFGDYACMDFFMKPNSEVCDPALDVWKTFLWEWSTERALPFETSFKQKYIYFKLVNLDRLLMLRILYFLNGLRFHLQDKSIRIHSQTDLLKPFVRRLLNKIFIWDNVLFVG